MNPFINLFLKRTEGVATVDFIITLLTSSTAENHNFTTSYSLGWRHLSLQNKFGIKKIKLVTIPAGIMRVIGIYFYVHACTLLLLDAKRKFHHRMVAVNLTVLGMK